MATPPLEHSAGPTGVGYVDAEFRLTFANAAFLRFIGVLPGEWRGLPLQQVLPESVFEVLRPQLDAAIRGVRTSFEPVLPLAAGGACALDAWFEPEVSPDGSTIGVTAILRNVTGVTAKPLAQVAREERYVDLFENAGEALFTLDLAGVVTAVNRGMEELSGYSRNELVGTPIATIVAPDQLLRLQQNVLGKAAEQPVTTYELDILTKRGERRNVMVSSRFILSDGRAVGVQGSVRDVTDVERQEQRLRLVVEHLPVGVWLTDNDGRILLDNPEGARIWGRRFRERDHEGAVAGRDLPSGRVLSGESWSLARVLASGEPVLDEVIEINGADGDAKTIVSSVIPLRHGDGPVYGTVVVNDDVTTLRQLEQDRETALAQLRDQIEVHVVLNAELRETAAARDAALRELQAALQVRDEFLSSVSHDLRTPLTALKGLTQLIRRRAARGPMVEGGGLVRQLETMEAAVDRMSGLVDDLLDLSRLEGGRALELVLSDCDLVGLAQKVASEQQRVSERHRIVVESNASSLWGRWDASRMERVLSNVIGNAVRYSPEGGEIVVSLSASVEGAGTRWAELRVRDHGVGIPDADLPRVFERFHRGANVAGLIKGTGVGLATVKQVVEQHGGSIAIESEVGNGTAVTIRLPTVPPIAT